MDSLPALLRMDSTGDRRLLREVDVEIDRRELVDFLMESNRIEGKWSVAPSEVNAALEFLALEAVTVEDLCRLALALEPRAQLRNRAGMNVRVGPHLPPPGGPGIPNQLHGILSHAGDWTPYLMHVKYETLHPFMDGNGRTGRLLWLWMMLQVGDEMPPLGFLHSWYYQSLQGARS